MGSPIWMVLRDGLVQMTYGPFATREEAETFTRTGGGFVYDARKHPRIP